MLRFDIGIDDAVVPDPGWVDYPVLLHDQAPRILAYQPATAVAEKFQAMIEIGLANSRMKDYHDIWMLAHTLEFDGQDLADAMRATFERRDTELPAQKPAEPTREYTGQPETSQMWDTYRTGFSASASDLPEDLQPALLPAARCGRQLPAGRRRADGPEDQVLRGRFDVPRFVAQ